ncbi:hypothetical protein PM10SUCC1_20760 [Propionigenium maris DSM 9537]|uniref:Uncharacterized protein n=1 Tax=Propionigenium maris DSM 9537 TaxID=1123000 RepID=A0A9W6GN13_9FUSO|nr:hypothetical protein [Propionigenium maris]GLI56562.1 hypothetical protein PM10SUCC1_20760 [Propionigenium maris DSM 9537]
MKDIPVRFNLSNSEERLDVLKTLLEVAVLEGDLKRVEKVIKVFTTSDDINEILESLRS